MKVFIIGASGFLGTKLMKLMGNDFEVFGSYVSNKVEGLYYLNITDKKAVLNLFKKMKPDVVIHAGGMTNVDACEHDRDMAWNINVLGTKNIIHACLEQKSKLVYVSTDYVFDGRKGDYSERDKPNPLSYYAKTKLESERMVLKCKNNLIIRPAILYGYNYEKDKSHFVKFVYTKLSNEEEVNAFTDWIRTPTLIDDIANALAVLIKNDGKGIYHVAGSEKISMYDFAIKISKVFNLDQSLINKAYAKDSKLAAERPIDSSLNISKIKESGIKMSNIYEGLELTKKQMKAEKT